MSQAINLRAVRWAYDQNDLSVIAKAVLFTFAIHADQRGYTWPSVDRIAFTWQLDRRTVRRQIEALLVRRRICRTKKRCGFTGQVKVYRLPKIAWESGGEMHPFENNESRDIRGTKMHPEYDINKEQTKISEEQRIVLLNYQYQNQPAQSHIKWPEFAAWCRSKGGTPTEKGFETWLSKQKPQWRNQVRKNAEEHGYFLDGKFFTTEEANQMAADDPNLTTKFRRAVKRNGTIKIIQ